MQSPSDMKLPLGKLLVVDDDFIVRQLSRTVLEEAGYCVHECTNGDTAVPAFGLHKPDIVLLDVIMPGKNGFEVCADIRSHPDGSDVPIIMMTGLDDTESILRAFREGATDFITKPICWETLPYRMQYIFKASQAFRDLRKSEKKLSYAQHIANMGSWEWNLRTNEVVLSETCRILLDLESSDSVRSISAFISLVHETDQDRLLKALDSLVDNGRSLDLDCRGTDLGGMPRYFHMDAAAPRVPTDSIVHVTGTIQNITSRKQTEEKVRYLAYYDSLTQLPNRVLFKEHLKQAMAAARQFNRMIALLFIDLDRFKGINDTMGHDAGDELLQQVAERIQHHVRGHDTVSRCGTERENSIVSRLGGDEFTILLDGILLPDAAAHVARRVISTLEVPFIIHDQEVFISASIGISIYPDDSTDADCLLKYADIAMYSAKDLGRGTYQYYTEEMNSASVRRLKIETQLRRALADNELSVHYQPQIDCLTGRVTGLEALARWTDGELGVISPDLFIPVAEDTGLIINLDRWVLETVCRQMAAWQAQGICPDCVSVNMSPRHFQKKYLHDSLEIILGTDEAVRTCLGIEITERSFLDNTEVVISVLGQIVDSNIRLSLDDFGTGYSSLSYLTRIPCRTLKIDRSFVSQINTDPGSTSIVTAIIALANSLGKEVIAEGVETIEQMNFLRSSGCRIMQGYLYGRPVPAGEIDCLLLANRTSALPRLNHTFTPRLPVGNAV